MKVINAAEVWGGDGLKIKYDRRRISYKKNNYASAISVEFVLNPVTLLIYVDTLALWHPPHENEQMSELDKSMIINSITRALKLLKVKYEIVSSNSLTLQRALRDEWRD
jgi:hypothetical protein